MEFAVSSQKHKINHWPKSHRKVVDNETFLDCTQTQNNNELDIEVSNDK